MFGFVMNEKKLQQCEAIFENLEATWKDLKYGKGKDHYHARHIITTIIVFTQSNSSKQTTINCVGLNFRFVEQVVEHKQLLDNEMEGVKWVKFDRKQWNDAICEIIKQIVIKWWIEKTKVNCNVKDVVRHLISTNNWEKHVAHFL
jgi:hypothetical protein